MTLAQQARLKNGTIKWGSPNRQINALISLFLAQLVVLSTPTDDRIQSQAAKNPRHLC